MPDEGLCMGAGCIVHCNKASKPVKGKYLLLCMNSKQQYVFPTNFIYFNHVFKSIKSLYKVN